MTKGTQVGKTIEDMLETLTGFQVSNYRHESYYRQNYRTMMPGIVSARIQQEIVGVVGWARIVIESLHERINFTGWDVPELREVYRSNRLASVSSSIHLDTLIYGCSYVSVTAGDTSVGEPEVLVRGHHAKSTYGVTNNRTGLLESAITVDRVDNFSPTAVTLWLKDAIISAEKINGAWKIVSSQDHSLGRVPLVKIVNDSAISKSGGSSEITPSIRWAIQDAVRAYTSQTVNREFFSFPQRYIVGLNDQQMMDENNNPVDPWKIIAGAIWSVPNYRADDEADEAVHEALEEKPVKPEIGQFEPLGAGPYGQQITGLALAVAAEAGIPSSYLGVQTSNPTSADAIRQLESRLTRKVRSRISHFIPAWEEVGLLALMILGKEIEETPSTQWENPETETLAATTDAITKMVASGVVSPTSEVVLKRLGFSPEEIRIMRQENAQQGNLTRRTRLEVLGDRVSEEARQLAFNQPDDNDARQPE